MWKSLLKMLGVSVVDKVAAEQMAKAAPKLGGDSRVAANAIASDLSARANADPLISALADAAIDAVKKK